MRLLLLRSSAQGARGRGSLLLLLGALLPVLLAGCGPGDPLEEIRELHAAGRFEESLEPLRNLLATRSDDPELHYLYGLALSLSGKPGLALWPLREAMESPDWLVPAGLQLAAGALQTGAPDRAIEAATRVLEAEPEHTGALVLRALARVHSRRDYEGALADAERALEIDPDDPEALIPRVVALLALERVEQAGAALDEIERRFREEEPGPQRTATYCAARASFAKEKGDAEAADRLYGECLERSSTRRATCWWKTPSSSTTRSGASIDRTRSCARRSRRLRMRVRTASRSWFGCRGRARPRRPSAS